MFIFKASEMLNAIEKNMPVLHNALAEIKRSGFDDMVMAQEFDKLEKISIDYGVMEKADNTVVIRGEMDWDDVGDWLALDRLKDKDDSGNVVTGNYVGEDSRNCIIFTDNKLVATLGVEDLIIVTTKDAVLVTKKDRAQDIKTLVAQLDSKYS